MIKPLMTNKLAKQLASKERLLKDLWYGRKLSTNPKNKESIQ